MVKGARWVVPALVAVAVLAAAWAWVRAAAPGSEAVPATRTDDARAGPPEGTLPRIDLGRLDRRPPEAGLGTRDLFAFATPRPPPPPPPPPSTEAPAEAAPVTAPTPPPLPPLDIKYIGTLETKRGLKVAMFLVGGKETLTGQAGEVVANRFKVVRIGLESVDVQDLGSEQVRRIPLKGN